VQIFVGVDIGQRYGEGHGGAVGRKLRIGDALDPEKSRRVKRFFLGEEKRWDKCEDKPRGTTHIDKIISHGEKPSVRS
jgi:hypothetical protein